MRHRPFHLPVDVVQQSWTDQEMAHHSHGRATSACAGQQVGRLAAVDIAGPGVRWATPAQASGPQAAQTDVDPHGVEVFRVELSRPRPHLGVLSMGWVGQSRQQVLVAKDAAAVLRRTGP